MRSNRVRASHPNYMGFVWRQQWNKRVRLGVKVGALKEARKLFHDQDERFNDSNRDGNRTDTQLHNPAAALHGSLGCGLGELALLGE